jgi:hypothetical protein
MHNGTENYDDFGEIPDEYPEDELMYDPWDLPDRYYEEWRDEIRSQKEVEIPEVDWAEDIENIDNLEIQQKEIEAAEKILDQESDLKEKLESGKITENQYLNEYEFGIRNAKRKATTRSALESAGLTYDDLGDVSEDWDFLVSGSPDLAQIKDQLRNTIDTLGPEQAQALADRMLAEGKLSQNTWETISRQVRLSEIE